MPGVDFNRIASNIAGLNAMNSLNDINSQLSVHRTRLATGKRINEAADDPAGLTIATKFNARAEGLGQALSNIGDAKNLMAVAEGGLGKIKDILIKMKTKATQAASDTLGLDERTAIQSQLTDWASEIDNIVATTKWNGNKLLDGLTAFTGTITFQAGADTDSADRISVSSTNFQSVSIVGLSLGAANSSVSTNAGGSSYVASAATVATGSDTSAATLTTGTFRVQVTGSLSTSATVRLYRGSEEMAISATQNGNGAFVRGGVTVNMNANTYYNLGNGVSVSLGAITDANLATGQIADISYTAVGSFNRTVSTAANASDCMVALDTAINSVSSRLQTVGTVVSRLTFREQNVTIAKTNVQAAYNRVMNADMAEEQLEATKMNILQQTAIAMLGQANQAPQSILSLFR